jgi:Xaa-Pro aminopeptidase
VIDFDYKARISSLRKNMESLKIDAIVFPTDANMEYFTSIPRQGSWTTKQRQNSSDYSCVLITDSDVIIFLPSLTYIVTMSKLQDSK